METERLAQIGHEAVRAISDVKINHWEKINTARQTAMIAVTDKITDKKISKAADVHEAWLDSMTKSGWTYGPKLSFRFKRHPHMVDFKKLPKEHKDCNKMFLKVIKAAAKV